MASNSQIRALRGQTWLGAVAAALLALAGIAPLGARGAGTEAPRFVEVAAEAGVTHHYTGDWEHFVGGGVAVLDCDRDGDPDLFFAGGSSPAQLFRNDRAGPAGANDRTDARLAFSRVADSGIAETAVTGAYPLDIDGDGHLDLAVLRLGADHLYRGLGDCRFARANERWGLAGGAAWTTAFSATWERSNRFPTLAFGRYVDRKAWTAIHTPFGEDPNNAGRFRICPDNVLVRPAGPRAERFGRPLALSPGHCTLSMLFSDWSRSGRPDLRVSNDRYYYGETGEEQLWRMAERPVLYRREDGWPSLKIWGMGIASHDLTGDGLPEYFLTSMMRNKLQTLVGDGLEPSFEDVAYRTGVSASHPHVGSDERPSTAWHAAFGDVDNDGLVDLFIAKGNVEAMEEAAAMDPNNLLLGEPGGTFREASAEAGVASYGRGRGAALVDLDLDGRLDIVVVNRVANVEIFHNRTHASGHWLQIGIAQPEPNRDAIGAWIELRAGARNWRQEVVVGGGHVSGQAGWRHFGLGAVDQVQVRVQWPDGAWGPWHDVEADRFVTIERGKPPVRVF